MKHSFTCRFFLTTQLLFLLSLLSVVPICAQLTNTVVGSNNIGDNGQAVLATLNDPEGVAVDAAGNTYITEGLSHRIRKISATGIITTIAGTGVAGFSGDGGPAITANLNYPTSIVLDAAGNIYFSDWSNNRIRKISPSGTISTVVGNGNYGFTGDGGPATAASLNGAYGIGIDGSGALYIADWRNQRIRKVSITGIITTIAGTGVAGFSGDGGLATAAQINSPTGVAVDASGNIYIGDYQNWRIRKILTDGTIITIAGTGFQGATGDGGAATSAQIAFFAGPSVDAAGNVYIPDFFTSKVRKISTGGIITRYAGLANGSGFYGDGSQATVAPLYSPLALAFNANGTLTIADRYNQRIRRISATGIISTICGPNSVGYGGDNDFATFARLNYPSDVKTDGNGSMYIAELSNSRIRKVDYAGIITTVAGGSGFGFSGDGGQATAARINGPYGVQPDKNGNFYISDTFNNRIRKVGANGIITTVAGTGISGFSGDNGLATNAQLKLPYNIALDKAGNLYIADSDNNRVRRVSTNGIIATVVGTGVAGFSGDGGQATFAQINFPTGIAIDSANNLYIADNRNQRIRKVSTSGIISTIAGTGIPGYNGHFIPATTAQLSYPFGITVSPTGIIFFCDNGNSRIRRVDQTTGLIIDIAGSGTRGYFGDGPILSSSQFDNPFGLTLDGFGNLLVADAANARIRRIDCIDPPTVSITSSSYSPCVGDVVTLKVNVANYKSGLSYVWSGNNVPISFDSVTVTAVAGMQSYSATVTTPTGCSRTASIILQAASMQSIKNGNWNDPTVWACGRVPTVKDLVTINTNHTIALTGNGGAKNLALNGKLINGLGGKLFLSDSNQVRIYDNVRITDTTLANLVVSISPTQIVFQSSATIDAYKVGNVIVGGVSPKTPYGFLRKIVSIQRNGNQVIFQTESAPLDQVFKNGDVRFDLSMPDISESDNPSLLETAFSQAEKGEGESGFNLNIAKKGIITDFDANLETTNDQITYDLRLKNHVLPFIDWDFKNKYGKAQLTVNGDYSLEIALPKINTTASISKQVTVKQWCRTFTRIIPVVVLGVVVPVPVVLTTVTKLNVGGEFSLSTKIPNSFIMSGKPNFIIGAEYDNGNWTDLSEFNFRDYKFTPLSLLPKYGEFNFKPFVAVPSIEVYVYDVTSMNQCTNVIQTEPKPDFVLEALLEANCAARLYPRDSLVMCASAKAILGIDIKPKIFGIQLPQYKDKFPFELKKEKCIGQVSNPTPVIVISQELIVKSSTEVEMKALIKNYKLGKVISYGICFSNTNINPRINDTKREIGVTGEMTDDKAFTMSATYLNPATIYIVRAFVRTPTDTVYSDILSVKTLAIVSAYSYQATNITSDSAQLQGYIFNFKTGGVLNYGICYSNTATVPTFNDSKITFVSEANPPDNKTFTTTLRNISAGTKYYYRTYATNPDGTVYGDVLSFVSAGVVVTTQSISVLSSTSAEANGFIQNYPDVINYGFCYSTTATQPTTNDSKVTFVREARPPNSKYFTTTLINLIMDTKYYIRAYATTSAGTIYGEVLSFTTLPLQLLIPSYYEGPVTGLPPLQATISLKGSAYFQWCDNNPNSGKICVGISTGRGTGVFTATISPLTIGQTTLNFNAWDDPAFPWTVTPTTVKGVYGIQPGAGNLQHIPQFDFNLVRVR